MSKPKKKGRPSLYTEALVTGSDGKAKHAQQFRGFIKWA